MKDAIWGVIDFEIDTDLPDIRNQTFVHTHEGMMFIIPREQDLVRFYIGQSTESAAALVDPATGRVDKNRASPEKLLAEARKILSPYKVEVKNDRIVWWNIYAGVCSRTIRADHASHTC